MKKVILLFLIFFAVQAGMAQNARKLSLSEVIELAKVNSRRAKQAETSLQFGYWNYRVYQSDFNPSLNLSGAVPSWNRSVTSVTQPNGTIAFREVNQSNSELELGLVQAIPYTNTTVSINTSTNRFDNFNATAGQPDVIYSGTLVNLRVIQPLFQVNPFKWNKRIEPLNYEQNKKGYAQTQEQIAVEATSLFFELLAAQIDLQIAQQNLSKNDTVFRIEQGRFNIGTTTEDQLLQTEINLLNSRRDAQQAQLDVQTRGLDLRNYIGLTEDVELELELPEEIPFFVIDPNLALDYAKSNRGDYLDFQIRRLEAERNVAEARAQRFSADVFASVGLNNQSQTFSDLYTNPNNQSIIRFGFNLPILDGGRNKARMGRALASQQLTEFQVEQDMINFEQEINTAVRNFDQIVQTVEISKKRDEIAQKRFDISNNRYLIGKIDILQYTNALNDKDQAKKGYVTTLRQYWNAYYQMRSLTLYDFLLNLPLYNPLLEYDPRDGVVVREEPATAEEGN